MGRTTRPERAELDRIGGDALRAEELVGVDQRYGADQAFLTDRCLALPGSRPVAAAGHPDPQNQRADGARRQELNRKVAIDGPKDEPVRLAVRWCLRASRDDLAWRVLRDVSATVEGILTTADPTVDAHLDVLGCDGGAVRREKRRSCKRHFGVEAFEIAVSAARSGALARRP